MNDDNLMTAVREPFGAVRMTTPLEAVLARGQARRRRRRLSAIVSGGAAACAAVGVAAAVTLTPGSAARPARVPEPGGARLAAWTVQTNRDGTVTFTLQNTSHPAQLERALAKAGVRAVVRWGKICEAGGPGQPLIGGETAFMANGSPLAGVGAYLATMGTPGKNPDLGWSWTVIPSKMPRDGQFVISAIPGPVPAEYIQAVWEFAKTSAPIGCAKFVKPTQRLVP
jgi:hypothetical protein